MISINLIINGNRVCIEEHQSGHECWSEVAEVFHRALIASGFILPKQSLVDELLERSNNFNEAIDK